jgi:hypothetical protein
LSSERQDLQARLSRLLDWERRKRREGTLTAALFYALVVALCAQPLLFVMADWAWALPLAVFAVFAPYFLFARRWRPRDTARALAALDRTLALDERATTAWELLSRDKAAGAALLVLHQAEARLKTFDPRALFPRTWHWHEYFLVPLFAVWVTLLWFDGGSRSDSVNARAPAPLSQTLREFARQLQDKAQRESLPQTLRAGRELEKIAQRGVDSKTADEQFKSELAGMAKKLASQRNASMQAPRSAPESRRELEDLRAELEGARDLFNSADGTTQSWQERLSGLTQLKKQLDKQNQTIAGQSRDQLKTLLEKMEKQVTGELDRRALLEAEKYLQQLAQRGQTQTGEAQAQAGGKEEQAAPKDGQREKNPGSAPGEEPGNNAEKEPSLPDFQGGARAHVKGTVGEGERSGIFFKAQPAPGKSKLSQDEVIASYQRQAEAELNTERIPDGLRDTIKNYFLSLEKAK